MIDPSLAWTIGTAVFAGGAAFGGVKVALNGTKARVQNLERASNISASTQTEMRERMVRVETKLDHISTKLDRM